MDNSQNITVTRNRGIKALKNLIEDVANENKDSDNKKFNDLRLRLGEVVKFYPGIDKVLVKFGDNTQKRCFVLHTVVSNEINISWTPIGYNSWDSDFEEPCIIPLNKFNAMVLSINGFNEDCVIGYVSRDKQEIIPNANTGELLLQYYDTSIKLMQNGIVINSEKIIVNGKPLDIFVSDSVNQQNYTQNELDNVLTDFEDRIVNLEETYDE